MKRKQIRNFFSSKTIPPRLFDVVVDGDDVTLEFKTGKNEYETISWPDVISLVEQARKSA